MLLVVAERSMEDTLGEFNNRETRTLRGVGGWTPSASKQIDTGERLGEEWHNATGKKERNRNPLEQLPVSRRCGCGCGGGKMTDRAALLHYWLATDTGLGAGQSMRVTRIGVECRSRGQIECLPLESCDA